MKKLLFLFLSLSQLTSAQNPNFKGSYEKKNNLVHTKLNLSFDLEKEHLLGEAWITLSPHFYPTDQLTLDAKKMLIHTVRVNGKKTKITYDGSKLQIPLGRTFKKGEEYLVYIDYTSRPNEIKDTEGQAITSGKGLYFINPLGHNTDKPRQIWSQGEPESNSAWFPTIDSPNQKTSQEIYLTVPDDFVTLSNGKLISQKSAGNGLRTDHWKQDKKHPPYLFFIGVGDFKITKDTWNGIPVNYYTEADYESTAQETYGMTPDMMTFFSNLYGYPYPWAKYSQITVRDFVSGAMENTSAVVHAEDANQKPGQLIDENSWEDIIAHELTHHWFGNLVTTESWSNITVNESFANYSEYLWREHRYGKDHAEAHRLEDIKGYLNGEHHNKVLVRHSYEEIRDVFDAVSYNKGGYILHMLRSYLGDDAFFTGLQNYLKTNAFKTGEAHQLRLALEETSGKDLNWFFDQWYFGSGHPEIEANYTYNKSSKKLIIHLKQNQEGTLFQFPLAVDLYKGNQAIRKTIWVKAKKSQTLEIPFNSAPSLVVLNADQDLLCTLKEPRKTIEQYILLYKYSKEYINKKEAIEQVSAAQNTTNEADQLLLDALKDPYYGLRIIALEQLDLSNKNMAKKSLELLVEMAKNDPKTLVQRVAIKRLAESAKAKDYIHLFQEKIKSESYAVAGEALKSLLTVNPQAAIQAANSCDYRNSAGNLKYALMDIYSQLQDESKLNFVAKNLDQLFMAALRQENLAESYIKGYRWVMKSNNTLAIKQTLEGLTKLNKRYEKYDWIKKSLVRLLKQALQISPEKKHKDLINATLQQIDK